MTGIWRLAAQGDVMPVTTWSISLYWRVFMRSASADRIPKERWFA
jgi:hypothetical protein